MFTKEKPWLKVYEGHAEPESDFFEGSLYELFSNCRRGAQREDRLLVLRHRNRAFPGYRAWPRRWLPRSQQAG